MARGVQLGEMLDAFRAEIAVSLDRTSAQNSIEQHRYALRNAQKFLYETWDWPMLIITRDKDLQAGERYYDFLPELPLENVHRVWAYHGADWIPVSFGIDPKDYSVFAEGTRSDPVRRWAFYDSTKFEVWPTPESAGKLRMRGKMALAPFVDEQHRCTLDDHLIVLLAAWKWLALKEPDKAQGKQVEFQTYANKLRGNLVAPKSDAFTAAGQPVPTLRPGIDYVNSR